MRAVQTVDALTVNTGNIDNAIGSASKVLSASYTFDYQMHGPIGPPCAVAIVKPDGSGLVMTNTQGVYRLRDQYLAGALGTNNKQLRVQYVEGASAFGSLRDRRRGLRRRRDVAGARQARCGCSSCAGTTTAGRTTDRHSSTTSAVRSTRTGRSSRSTTRRGSCRGRTRRRPRAAARLGATHDGHRRANTSITQRRAVHDREPPGDEQVACRSSSPSEDDAAPGSG